MNETRLRDRIRAYGESLFDRGLTAGSSGNLSARLDDGWLLTPTNSSLGALDPARLSKLDWEGWLVSGEGGPRPWIASHAGPKPRRTDERARAPRVHRMRRVRRGDERAGAARAPARLRGDRQVRVESDASP